MFCIVVETLFQNWASLENDDLHNDSISEQALPWHCLSLFLLVWPTILKLKVPSTGPKSHRVSKSALLQNQGNILVILEQKHRSSKEEILRFLIRTRATQTVGELATSTRVDWCFVEDNAESSTCLLQCLYNHCAGVIRESFSVLNRKDYKEMKYWIQCVFLYKYS